MRPYNLAFWQEKRGNYGDELSPYIISKLSNIRLRYKKYIYHGLKPFIKFIYWNLKEHRYFRLSSIAFPYEKTIVAIGSLLGQTNKNCNIWGTGFMNNTDIFHGGKLFAVRGKYSNDKIIEAGFSGTHVYGDPAMLLPLVLPGASCKKFDIGIIPHIFETDYFINKYSNLYKVIDLRSHDVERITDEITSCKCILSSSLHGLIVPHAYGIPALWIQHSYINTDGFKFKDYFSSVNIEPYIGFNEIDVLRKKKDVIQEFFNKNIDKSLPNIDLTKLQKGLLTTAPFPLKNELINLIK